MCKDGEDTHSPLPLLFSKEEEEWYYKNLHTSSSSVTLTLATKEKLLEGKAKDIYGDGTAPMGIIVWF